VSARSDAMGSIKLLISVCVCTYNRSEILAHCLKSLSQLADPRPKHDIEVIVVDNNSNDGTSNLVRGLIADFPFELRYVFEGLQGLSAARNRAVQEAKGDYIAFLDDECVVEHDWLSVAISDIEEFHPSFIGGPYFGVFLPGDRPRWFKIEYGDAYFLQCGLQRGFQHEFRASGGNMLVRRDVFEEVRFDIAMGAIANSYNVGEETYLQEQFLQTHNSEKVFYEPALVVHHFILPTKMQLSYSAKRLFLNALRRNQKSVTVKRFLIALSKVAVLSIISPIRCALRNRKKYPYWQNDAYERALPQASRHAGTVVKYVRDHWARIRSISTKPSSSIAQTASRMMRKVDPSFRVRRRGKL
jgi:glucosyl-dolichyl phosphate glucuronosyltransferase